MFMFRENDFVMSRTCDDVTATSIVACAADEHSAADAARVARQPERRAAGD